MTTDPPSTLPQVAKVSPQINKQLHHNSVLVPGKQKQQNNKQERGTKCEFLLGLLTSTKTLGPKTLRRYVCGNLYLDWKTSTVTRQQEFFQFWGEWLVVEQLTGTKCMTWRWWQRSAYKWNPFMLWVSPKNTQTLLAADVQCLMGDGSQTVREEKSPHVHKKKDHSEVPPHRWTQHAQSLQENAPRSTKMPTVQTSKGFNWCNLAHQTVNMCRGKGVICRLSPEFWLVVNRKLGLNKRWRARFRGLIWKEKSSPCCFLSSPLSCLSLVWCTTTCFTQLSLPQGTVRQFGSTQTLIHWARWFKAFGGHESARQDWKHAEIHSWFSCSRSCPVRAAEAATLQMLPPHLQHSCQTQGKRQPQMRTRKRDQWSRFS